MILKIFIIIIIICTLLIIFYYLFFSKKKYIDNFIINQISTTTTPTSSTDTTTTPTATSPTASTDITTTPTTTTDTTTTPTASTDTTSNTTTNNPTNSMPSTSTTSISENSIIANNIDKTVINNSTNLLKASNWTPFIMDKQFYNDYLSKIPKKYHDYRTFMEKMKKFVENYNRIKKDKWKASSFENDLKYLPDLSKSEPWINNSDINFHDIINFYKSNKKVNYEKVCKKKKEIYYVEEKEKQYTINDLPHVFKDAKTPPKLNISKKNYDTVYPSLYGNSTEDVSATDNIPKYSNINTSNSEEEGQYYPEEEEGKYYPEEEGQYYPQEEEQYYPQEEEQYYPQEEEQYYPQEEEQYYPQEEEQYYPQEEEQYYPQEEEQYYPQEEEQYYPQEEEEKLKEEEQIPEEEEMYKKIIINDDTNKKKEIKIPKSGSNVNINITYNAQNSKNNLSNSINDDNKYDNNQKNNRKKRISNSNYDNDYTDMEFTQDNGSRIHTNKDWMYPEKCLNDKVCNNNYYKASNYSDGYYNLNSQNDYIQNLSNPPSNVITSFNQKFLNNYTSGVELSKFNEGNS